MGQRNREESVDSIKFDMNDKLLKDLTESEERFRTIAEQSFMGIGIAQDNKIQYLNQAYADIWGYTIEEMMNWTEKDLLKAIHPDDREFCLEQSTKKQKGDTDVVNRYQYRGIKKTGEVLWVETYSKTINYNQRPANFITLIDITERKITEEELKYKGILVAHVNDAIISTDLEFNIISWNNGAEKIYGWEETEVIGKNIMEIIPMKYIEIEQSEVLEFFFENGYWRGEVEQPDKSGKILNIDSYVTIIKDSEGNSIGAVAINRNITERKQAEQKLIASESRFKGIFDNASHGIALINPNGNFITFNERAASMLGYSLEEFAKKTPFEVTHPEDIKSSKELMRKLLSGEIDSYRTEKRYLTKDGKEFWVDLSVRALYDVDGSINSILGILVEINSQKKAELKLKESERKVKEERDNLINMLNSMKDGVYIVNQEYDIEYINPSLKLDFGHVGNKKCYEYFQNLEGPCPWCENLKHDQEGSVRWEWDSPITKKNYEIIATPIKNVEGMYSKLVIFHDITERKVATQKLKAEHERAEMYLNLAGVIILALDHNGNVTLMNKKGYEILEFEEGELTGKNWFEMCIPKETRDDISYIFAELMKGKLKTFEYAEGPILTKNHKKKIIAWNNTLLRDEKGNIIGTLSSGEDITERKKAEEELKKLTNLKSELIRRTSHEFKTPLISIKGFTQLLIELYGDSFDPYVNDTLYEILSGAERLEDLVSDFLKTSELESGSRRLKKSKEDLSFLIRLCVSELKGFAELRKHQVTLEIPPKLLAFFEKEQIHTVVSNLLSNAFKYTPPGGYINIKTVIKDDFIITSIKDSGIGFNEGEKSYLFQQFGKIERFGQGYDIITEGSGLGLYISKMIVDLHGGELWVESEGRNKGSTVYFTLPIPKT